MSIGVFSLAFAIAFACVVTMGFAIQRGATCTVAAVDELLTRRSVRRLLSMAEASLWVAGGLLVAQALHMLPAMPAGYATGAWTIAGGVLLGLGAWVNRACVFGAIARLGSGEWAYAATPLGYFLGCLTVGALFGASHPEKLADASPVLGAPAWVAILFLAFAAWRLGPPLVTLDRGTLRMRVWAPHAATTVIGITFFFTLMIAGAWAYTDVLQELAHGMSMNLILRVLLFVALLLGAAWGGWTAGRWNHTMPTARQLARCLAGGALMAWGTLLIPGSNDGLILLGMPLLRPYAWVAFGTMCVTIGIAEVLRGRHLAATVVKR